MESGDETAIKLIRSIKKRPELWNRSSTEYKNKKKAKTDGWLDVADELHTTVTYCQNKWRRIRTNFIKYVKLKTPERFNLYEEIKFIFPHLNVVKKGNLVPVIEIEDSDYSDDDENPHEEESNENLQTSYTNSAYVKQEEEEIELEPDMPQYEEPDTIEEHQNKIEEHYVQKRSNARDSNEEQSRKRRRSSTVNPDQATSSAQQEEENPMMLFFKSITPDLMQLSTRKQRLFKRGCLDLIETLYRDEPDSY